LHHQRQWAFTVASKGIKILRSKFNQRVEDLCPENYQILPKEIKEDLKKKPERHPCS
jgi:hypothetical protein